MKEGYIRTFRERKEIRLTTALKAKKRQAEEAEGKVKWGYEESGLLTGKYPFNETFLCVLPEGYNDLKTYAEDLLRHKKGEAVGLELGGTGARLFGDFDRGLFDRTAGISLTDNRHRIDPSLLTISDDINHQVILGDMFAPETKRQIENDFLKGEKVDIIFERAIRGQDYYPDDADFMAKEANFWYQHLAVNGVMLLTPPSSILFNYMQPWEEMIKDAYKEQIEVQLDPGLAVRIKKLSNAPEHLPLIDMRQDFRARLSKMY